MKLLEPLPLGRHVAPNRLLFGPHVTNLGRRRALSDGHVAYYERRAAGGCGVVVVEEAAVHASDWPYERSPLASRCGPGWSAIAAACHRHGALTLAGIGHSGGQGSSAFSQTELWAPSGVPEVNTREVPKVMEDADIDTVVAAFAHAAAAAVAAGMDGVEVNAGQHSLVRQFLSGLTNLRWDGHGQDRTAFARRVLEEVRAACGDSVVGLRLSCDELAPWAGIVPEAGAAIAAELAGWVDYVAVVRGGIFSVAATRPDTHEQPGFNLGLAALVRSALEPGTAVVAQGSIVDVAMAEQALVEGHCDGVEMTRAQIAEPDLARLAAAGQVERIRPCVLCNQRCMVRDNRNPVVTCIGNPEAGHETEDPPLGGRAVTPRQVLVVGGGPAGLECARVAAGRGHEVRLMERTARLGGAAVAAAAGHGRAPLGRLVEWLAAECARLGVAVETGREATLADLEAADAAVLCTGSRAGLLDAVVEPGADVRTARDILSAAADLGRPDAGATAAGQTQPAQPGAGGPAAGSGAVAVWDPVGGPEGVSVAELLAATGTAVFLVTPDHIAASLLGLTGDLAPANVRLQAAGVDIVRRSLLRAVGPGWVEIEDRFSGVRRTLDVTLVVDAGHRLPEESLWQAAGHRHLRAGDAVAPRTIHEAILEGRRAALALEEEREPGQAAPAEPPATAATAAAQPSRTVPP